MPLNAVIDTIMVYSLYALLYGVDKQNVSEKLKEVCEKCKVMINLSYIPLGDTIFTLHKRSSKNASPHSFYWS